MFLKCHAMNNSSSVKCCCCLHVCPEIMTQIFIVNLIWENTDMQLTVIIWLKH